MKRLFSNLLIAFTWKYKFTCISYQVHGCKFYSIVTGLEHKNGWKLKAEFSKEEMKDVPRSIHIPIGRKNDKSLWPYAKAYFSSLGKARGNQKESMKSADCGYLFAYDPVYVKMENAQIESTHAVRTYKSFFIQHTIELSSQPIFYTYPIPT